MTLRYGLIGFGRFGKLHASSIERTQGAALGAICTASEASAVAAAAGPSRRPASCATGGSSCATPRST